MMPTCPQCQTVYPHGTIACLPCAHVFESDAHNGRQPHGLLPALHAPGAKAQAQETCVELHVIHVDGHNFKDGEWVARVPMRASGLPIRIGHADPACVPPIAPEIDLAPLLLQCRADDKWIVSRLHATLEHDDQGPLLRQVAAERCKTWLRRSGVTHYIPVESRTGSRLHNRDTIVFGPPNARHVKLRIFF